MEGFNVTYSDCVSQPCPKSGIREFISKSVRSVWYMCLKIENCYLKTFVKIRVGEKMYENT